MRDLTIEENKVLIQATKILKNIYKSENCWMIMIHDKYPIKIPEKEKIRTYIHVVADE